MSLTKEEKTAIAAACYADPVLFCRTFLSHWFPDEMPWVHRGILAILLQRTDFLAKYGDIDKIARHFVYVKDGQEYSMFQVIDDRIVLISQDCVAIMMPRGYSKTTLVNAALIFLIEYQDCLFPLLVSETGRHSTNQLGNVKREVEGNGKLIDVFGVKAPTRQDPEKWTEDMITTVDGITVTARGRGGQVRGLNYNAHRPDVIVVDDVEDKESVSTAEQIKKTRSWFYGDLLPCRAKTGARVVVLGTLLHEDALLMHLSKDPSWTFIRFGVIDKDGDLLWPAGMNNEKIERTKESYSLAGQLREFYMEYYSELRNEASQKFRKEFIRYDVRPELIATAIAMDPAISSARKADDATIAVVGMTAKGQIHVCDIWGEKGVPPRVLIDKYFEMIFQYNPNLYGIESIQYQAALVHLVREEMFRKKKYFEIVPITHQIQKQARILGILQPRYAAGYVTHARIFAKLETQLLDFPSASHDDYPDVVAMAVSLLDPYAAQAADPTKDLGDNEYEELDAREFNHAI